MTEFKLPEHKHSISFNTDNGANEILRIADDGFYVHGEKVEDIHDVYTAFNEWVKAQSPRGCSVCGNNT